MTRLLTALLVALLISGCAHKELKAPCKNIAAFNAGDVPCDRREPLNGDLPLSLYER